MEGEDESSFGSIGMCISVGRRRKFIEKMEAAKKAIIMAKAHNLIKLSLSDEFLREALTKQTLRHYGRSLKVNTKRNP